jgi:hypothetical protein
MMNETEWKDFVARARRDGKLIENVIKDTYVSNIDRAGNALDGGAHVGRRASTSRTRSAENEPEHQRHNDDREHEEKEHGQHHGHEEQAPDLSRRSTGKGGIRHMAAH